MEEGDPGVMLFDDHDELMIQSQLDEKRLKRLACEPGVNDFQRDKLEKDAKKNWDLFYKRNGDRFFKNRYWTKREFREELFNHQYESEPELAKDKKEAGAERAPTKYLLEIGCGCGNFVLPLLEDFFDNNQPKPNTTGGVNHQKNQTNSPDNLFIYCTDISEKAIEILKSNPIYKQHHPDRINSFAMDITEQNVESLATHLNSNQMDVVSLVFVLSALEPNKMKRALINISRATKPNGLILFRDYAIYDEAMLRFSEKSKISDRFYVRQDGTRAYFFTKKQLVALFESCGFYGLSIDYIKNETVNHATKDKYSRVFLQAKFIKLTGQNSSRVKVDDAKS